MSGTATPVIAGLAIGSAFIVLFATISIDGLLPSTKTNLIIDQYKYLNLTIGGLKDLYKMHEPLGFTLDVNGFDSTCDVWPDITIADSAGKVIWTFERVSLMGCGDPELLSPHNIHASWNVAQIGVPLDINQTGSYTLKATYYGKTVEQGFTVHGDTVSRNSTQVASISPTYPVGAPVHSCPFIPVRSSVKIQGSTGFRVYNTSSGFADYVLEPGVDPFSI
jgi:hypothetical protein